MRKKRLTKPIRIYLESPSLPLSHHAFPFPRCFPPNFSTHCGFDLSDTAAAITLLLLFQFNIKSLLQLGEGERERRKEWPWAAVFKTNQRNDAHRSAGSAYSAEKRKPLWRRPRWRW